MRGATCGTQVCWLFGVDRPEPGRSGALQLLLRDAAVDLVDDRRAQPKSLHASGTRTRGVKITTSWPRSGPKSPLTRLG